MRSATALLILLASMESAMSVSIPYTVDTDGKVSLAVYSIDGQEVLRTILTGAPRTAGSYAAFWDGLDRYGNAVPTGTYTWKMICVPGQGLKSEFILGVGSNQTPKWERGVGNHIPPNAIGVDSTGVYFFAGMGEGGILYDKTDFDGNIIWAFHSENMWTHGETAGRSVALVGDRIFSLCDNGAVYGFYTSSGQCFTNGNYDPKPWNIGAAPSDIAGDIANNLLVVCYRNADRISWRSTSNNGEVDQANGIEQPVSVAVGSDGTVYAIANGAVVKISRVTKTPQTVIAASQLQSPWRLSIDRRTGDIFVAENSDLGGGSRHHQVKQFTNAGALKKTFGQASGRTDGAYVNTDFLHITDIATDGQGGFLVTEGDWTPPRRTVHINGSGTALHEWLGGQAYGTMCAPEPEDPRHVWMVGNAPTRGLVRFEIDYENQTATITDIFTDMFSANDLGSGPGIFLSTFEYNQRVYISTWSPGLMSLLVFDKNTHSLRFSNYFGNNTVWNDLNDNGLAETNEKAQGTIGGYIDPTDMTMYGLPWQTNYSPGAVTSPQSFTAGGTPVYSSQNSRRYPPWRENGEQFDVGSLVRGPDGHWFGCLSALFDARDVPYAKHAIEPHGVWYFNSCSAIDRLVTWDSNWNQLWSVGRHSADADHEIGSTAMPRNVVGTAKGCVIWADGSDEEIASPIVWTDDGLYVDELFHKNDLSTEEVYGLNTQNEYSNGNVCVDPSTGDVYLFYISNSVGAPVYKVTGWDGWLRNEGTVTLDEQTSVATLLGTGLKGEYFNNKTLSGSPALTRTESEVYMVWCADAPAPGVDADNFSVRWSGKVQAPTTEEYTFSFETKRDWVCDGTSIEWVKLWVDNKLISNPNKPSGFWPGNFIVGRALLEAGKKYEIRCEASYGTGDAVAWLCWETPSRDRRHIQKQFLYPEAIVGASLWSGGLQAQWHVDEGTGVLTSDASGNNHAALLTSESWNAQGIIGSCLALGSGATASCDVDVSESAYTLSLWFKTLDTDGGLFSISDARGGHDRDIWLENGSLKAMAVSSVSETISADGEWTDDSWHQVIHVLGGPQGGQRLYVDGILRAMGSTRSSSINGTSILIGSSPQASGVLSNGRLDEVRIYPRALSDREIIDNVYRKEVGLIGYFPLDEAAGMHPSSFAPVPGIFGSFTGTVDWVSGKFGEGIEFRSTGSFGPAQLHVEHEVRLPATDYTVAFWFKTASSSAGLFKAARNSSYNNAWQDNLISLDGGRIRLQTAGEPEPLHASNMFNDNQWHHVALTIGGATGVEKLYVDAIVEITGQVSIRERSSNRLGVDFGPGGDVCRVAMDELRVYGRALGSEEISDLYNLNPEPITSVIERGGSEDLWADNLAYSDDASRAGRSDARAQGVNQEPLPGDAPTLEEIQEGIDRTVARFARSRSGAVETKPGEAPGTATNTRVVVSFQDRPERPAAAVANSAQVQKPNIASESQSGSVPMGISGSRPAGQREREEPGPPPAQEVEKQSAKRDNHIGARVASAVGAVLGLAVVLVAVFLNGAAE